MVKVSVIIPCYKTEKWLPACLDSVLAQTLNEIEVICIDDASPDGCAQIMDGYAERDPRVKTIHLPENHKQGYGRNRGMEIAQGEYIYLLDSDDMITPDALERLYALAEEERLDGVYFDAQIIYDNDELREKYPPGKRLRKGVYPDGTVTGLELFRRFREQKEWNVYVQAQFWRRAFLREHDIWFPEGIEHEDQLFGFMTITLAERVCYRRWPLFIRRYRPDSVMTKGYSWVNVHGYFVNLYRMADFIRKHEIEDPDVMEEIGHLIVHFKSLYDLVPHPEHPDRTFAAQGLETEFRLFEWFYKAESTAETEKREREELFWKPLTEYRDLTIYGTGKIADSVFRRLCAVGIQTDRFAVTDPKSAPAEFHARDVVAPEEIPVKERAAVLAALSREYHPEVAAVLDRLGVTYYLYAKGVLQGPFRRGVRDEDFSDHTGL
ncbi:MAG: glycosyltransferase [Lachnospiraceae bacterium]|nr:glycosyltransferase [Lachnospiraceae bacterium]